MTREEAAQKLALLDAKKEEIKAYYKELADVLAILGKGTHFQSGDGLVYEIVEPDGKFVPFDKLAYKRTKKPHEERGELSVKRAEELGYVVPKGK